MNEKLSLSLIGVGAFGRFIIPYLTPYFDVLAYDKYADISDIAHIKVVDFETAASANIVIIGVPVQAFEDVVMDLKGRLRPGQTIMDITSVKMIPMEIFEKHIPLDVSIVGLHPMFGPNSGRNGIEGLNITAVKGRGNQYDNVCRFLSDSLKLNVIQCTANQHDKDMAYAQGLTHIVAKSFASMDIPQLMNTTKTYDLLSDIVDLIKNDSDELFKAIQSYNPHAKAVRDQFFRNIENIDKNLSKK